MNELFSPASLASQVLLFGAAQDFNSQFLNLFGFSISVSFVCCLKIWMHLGKITAVLGYVRVFSVQIQ